MAWLNDVNGQRFAELPATFLLEHTLLAEPQELTPIQTGQCLWLFSRLKKQSQSTAGGECSEHLEAKTALPARNGKKKESVTHGI